jgi:protein SCO1/2
VVGAVVALLLAGCGGGPSATIVEGDNHGFHGAYLTRPYVVPKLALTDTSGAPYTVADDPAGHLRLVFFGYTHCPDECPATMSTIALALVKLSPAERKRVQTVFVTTDPPRDTGPVLRKFLDRFNPGFVGLTGSLDRIDALGKPLGVFLKKGAMLPSGGYDVSHSTAVLAVTGRHVPLVWTQGTSPAQMAADISRLLKESA